MGGGKMNVNSIPSFLDSILKDLHTKNIHIYTGVCTNVNSFYQ